MLCWRTPPRLASVGVKHLIVSWQHPTIEQILDPLQRFGEEVVRKAS